MSIDWLRVSVAKITLRLKGIDDAALQNTRLNVISIKEWSNTLTGKPLEEIKQLWGSLSFDPATE